MRFAVGMWKTYGRLSSCFSNEFENASWFPWGLHLQAFSNDIPPNIYIYAIDFTKCQDGEVLPVALHIMAVYYFVL